MAGITKQTFQQGSKSPEFFPTFRTILEISVNLERKNFMGGGRGSQISVQEHDLNREDQKLLGLEPPPLHPPHPKLHAMMLQVVISNHVIIPHAVLFCYLNNAIFALMMLKKSYSFRGQASEALLL